MPKKTISLTLLLTLLLAFPFPAFCFWGNDGDNSPSLNFKSGYDINTVTTVTGRIIAIQTGEDRPNVQLVLENNGVTSVICIGPQRYWAENPLPFKTGDAITVRGSKAQGRDGVIYIMAQKIADTTQDVSFVLRDESGRPAWAGGSGLRRKQPQGQ